MIDVLVWNKYTRVVMQLAERLNISPEKALHLFYNSKVYALLLNKQYPLITLSDAYITDEIILELDKEEFLDRVHKFTGISRSLLAGAYKSLYLYIYSQLSNPFLLDYSVGNKGI